MRQEFSGTKPIRIEEVEETLVSKLTENGHPIKNIHMRHFTDRYTLEVMRIRDKEGFQKHLPALFYKTGENGQSGNL